MSLKSRFINMYNAIMKEESSMPEGLSKVIISGEQEIPVIIGSQVFGSDGNVIPDGNYQIKDSSLILVVQDGKGDIKAKADIPSDQEVIKQDDVQVELSAEAPADPVDAPANQPSDAPADVELSAESQEINDVEVSLGVEAVGAAIEQVVDADIAAEDNPDTTTEEVESHVAVEDALAEIRSTLQEFQSRIEVLEAKLSDSALQFQEVKDQVENFSQVTPSVKVASNPYQQFANLFK